MNFLGPGQLPMYTGAIDCVKKTLANEGFRGLYKGMSTPLVGVAPIFALGFFGNNFGKEQIRKFTGNSTQQELGVASLALAGGFSGLLATSIMAPGERIKCILQVQQSGTSPLANTVKYTGPLDVAIKLYREGGIRSIYKGTIGKE